MLKIFSIHLYIILWVPLYDAHRVGVLQFVPVRAFYENALITGSTVVLTCCKGDCQSQWKTPIFGPPQLGNPLTDFDKI